MSDADATPPTGNPEPDLPPTEALPTEPFGEPGGVEPVNDLPPIIPATPDLPSDVDEVPPVADDATTVVPTVPPVDATTVAAATTVMAGAGAMAGADDGVPPGATTTYGLDDEEPWYRRPGPLAAAIVAGLVALGLIIFAIAQLTGDDGATIVITDSSSTTTAVPDTSTSEVPATSEAPSSTVEESTTTVVETTAPPPVTTAPPTAPPTTAAPVPTTTIPEVVVPPQPDTTLWDIIVNSPDLSDARALFELAGLDSELDDPNATYTVFVPTNQAIQTAAAGVGAPDFGDPDVVRNILLAHIHEGDALTASDIVGLPAVAVMFGGPQTVDASANPATIGGARPVVVDVEASNGVLHVIDLVLTPA